MERGSQDQNQQEAVKKEREMMIDTHELYLVAYMKLLTKS
jgi:hypothetical protein